MRLPVHQWPNTELGRGALFFFQHVREMVADDTPESFRVMTLDTVARLEEASSIVEQVQGQKIPPAALEPVYAEMRWSLAKDPVAEALVGEEILAILTNFDSKKLSPTDQLRNLRYLQRRLSRHYKEALETKILEVFPVEENRLRLRQLTGFYCSHLINLGYSRHYILRTVDDEFFAEPIQRARPQLLMRFFECFDAKPRSMSVTTPVAPNCAGLLKRLNAQVVLGTTQLMSPAARQYFGQKADQHYSTLNVKAYDEEGAVRVAEHRLASLRAITFINPQPSTFTWDANHFVIRSKAGKGLGFLVPENVVGPAPVELLPGGRNLKAVTRSAKLFNSGFDSASTERLLNSFNTCALARKSGDRELQLISIWSAIEVLLSEPDPGRVRIVHYVTHLAPCVCLRYIRRQIAGVYERLVALYKVPFVKLVKRENLYQGEDIIMRFAMLLLSPDCEDLRAELLALLSRNPLALNRVAKLNADYANPKKLHGAVEAHFDRVSWQLHRIYRARNNMVHSGRVPSFLDALVLNAFEYYATTVRAVGSYGKRHGPEANIDQAVTDIGIDYMVQMRFASGLRRQQAGLTAEQIAIVAAA